jgi:hypothetical protein
MLSLRESLFGAETDSFSFKFMVLMLGNLDMDYELFGLNLCCGGDASFGLSSFAADFFTGGIIFSFFSTYEDLAEERGLSYMIEVRDVRGLSNFKYDRERAVL